MFEAQSFLLLLIALSLSLLAEQFPQEYLSKIPEEYILRITQYLFNIPEEYFSRMPKYISRIPVRYLQRKKSLSKNSPREPNCVPLV